VNHRHRRFIERKARRKVGAAIKDYSMIFPGDRILVAVSGGMDSIVLLKLLSDIKGASPVQFDIIPVHLDTGFESGFEDIASWCRAELGLEVEVIATRISSILKQSSDPSKSPCGLCSRLRRGMLYHLASNMGATSIALGHHMDDIIETFFLRVLYTGQIGAMAPSRVSNDGKNRIIRPLAYCTKELVESYFGFMGIHGVSINCPLRTDSKREMVRQYLETMEKDIPNLRYSVFASLGNIDEKSLCLKESKLAHYH